MRRYCDLVVDCAENRKRQRLATQKSPNDPVVERRLEAATRPWTPGRPTDAAPTRPPVPWPRHVVISNRILPSETSANMLYRSGEKDLPERDPRRDHLHAPSKHLSRLSSKSMSHLKMSSHDKFCSHRSSVDDRPHKELTNREERMQPVLSNIAGIIMPCFRVSKESSSQSEQSEDADFIGSSTSTGQIYLLQMDRRPVVSINLTDGQTRNFSVACRRCSLAAPHNNFLPA